MKRMSNVEGPRQAPYRVAREDMQALGQALLEHAGAPPEQARMVVQHLVAASAMGIDSHGIMRIPQYLAEIESQGIDPQAKPEFLRTAPGRLEVDGRWGFGQVVGALMVDAIVPLARETGIAMASGRHLGHTGRIGAYAEAIAKAGLIGLVVCNGAPSGHWVAPFGGRDGRLSTNPLAISWPIADEAPVVADFSTAMAPEGVVRVMRDRGEQAPEGVLRNADGQLSRDPNVLYGVPKGTIQPFGGQLGYRGTALALLVEVLTTLVNGDAVNDHSRKGTDMTLLAMTSQKGFEELSRGLADHIRSSPPLDPAQPVLMPGDREKTRAAYTTLLSVDRVTWTALSDAASRARLDLPALLEET